jgi:hypothetical protein
MHRAPALLGLPLAALLLAACGNTTATASFKGEQHAVAQAISNLQAHATAGEQSKICTNDLSATIVTSLGGTKHCETAIKDQLAEINNLEVNIQTIHLAPHDTSATASTTSTYEGKIHPTTLTLTKEHGTWRITGVQLGAKT